MKRSLQSLGLLLLAFVTPAWASEKFDSIYISEVLVENGRSVPAKDGGSHGWIELYNGGSDTVNLADWFLSDTPTNLTKWRFPRVVMLPDSYLLVSASGKGQTNDLADLHINFLLDTKGGQLVLAGRATNLVSQILYPKSMPDVSYGCVRGEPGIRGNFAKPTPGKANQSSGSGFAPPVTFSSPSGSITSPVVLNLSCAAVNASSNLVIRYTLDGSLPNSRSPVYGEPLQITNTIAVRARAYAKGLLPGPPGSEVYLWLSPGALKFNSSLPVLVMNSVGIDRPPHLRSSYLSFHEPVDGKTSLNGRPALAARGGFHVHGSSTTRLPQPSLAMKFLDEFNEGQNHSVLGLPANSDWVLYAPNMYDPVLIHNPFIHQLSRDMGRYSPRTRFLEVYIVQHPGPVRAEDYAGLYVLEEKIRIGKHRVPIDKLGPNDLKAPEVTGGYLLKFDRTGPGEQGLWAGGAEMVYVDPKESVIELPQRAPQRRYIAKYFDDFDRVLQSPDWKDPIKGYRAYIDVDSWIDYHVLEVLSGNVDIFRYSTFFYKPRGGKITFGPHWDFDRALGSTDHRDANPRRWNTGRFFDGAWWNQIFTDPDFWQLWVDRWQPLRRTHFSETNLFDLIDRLSDEVREAQPREADRWGLEPRGGSYQSEIDWMKRWLAERIDFIDRQLVQPPVLSQAGGEVSAGFQLMLKGAEGGAIYYTLDGSDPRQPQGAISPRAMIYSGPIALERDARVMIRARNPEKRQMGGPPISTPWSSPVSANFTIRRSPP
ncbi:MAG: Por secretion system C-terminal sorting protein [Verrucomicrobiales bacterium]|nr:Por secretion system C-terminal sorting protein [Verrucomicrobiales bacterium]